MFIKGSPVRVRLVCAWNEEAYPIVWGANVKSACGFEAVLWAKAVEKAKKSPIAKKNIQKT
jgi:hypothetical protein